MPGRDTRLHWGDSLREFREDRGLSKGKVARAAGLSRTEVGRIERGGRTLPEHRSALGRALGEPGMMLTGKETKRLRRGRASG